MAMDQYLLIPFLGEWTSIYQLFWCSPGVQGFWHTAIYRSFGFRNCKLLKHRPDLLFGIEARPEPPTGVGSPRVGLIILRVSQLVLGWTMCGKPWQTLVSERPLLTSSNYLWLRSLWSLTSWICSDLFKICSRFPGFIKWSSAFKCQYAGNIGGIGGTWGIVWD